MKNHIRSAIVALAALFAPAAAAQMTPCTIPCTPAQLNTELGQVIYTNGQGKITAATLAPFMSNIVGSMTPLSSIVGAGTAGYYISGFTAAGAPIFTALPNGATLPSIATSQLYGGSGVGQIAQGVTVGTGLSLSGGTLSATGSVSLSFPLTVAGTTTSGGIPYFNSTTQLSSSGLLAANALMIGGGAGAAPSTITTGANVATALGLTLNGSGAISATTSPVFVNPALGTPASGNLVNTTGYPLAALTGAGTSVLSVLANNINGANGLGQLNASGLLPLAIGGANAALTASNGGIVYSTASALGILSGTPTAGQCLLSGSNTIPSWGSCSGAAAVSSVSNSDGTLTISPTTGVVVASLNLAHANTWTGAQTHTGTGNQIVLGANGGNIGSAQWFGSTSGSVTVQPQAVAGTAVALTWPNTSGTFAVGASSPLALSATTGNLTCATCVTSSGGGAITGTAPVAVSAAGAVSITGAAGQVLAGASPAFTATPTLGVPSSATGTLALANSGSANTLTITPASVATSARTLTLPDPGANDSFAYLAATQTFTNKTLTSPTFGGTVAGANTVPLSILAQVAGGTVLGNATGSTANVAATATPTLGVAGSVVGSVAFANATSGSVTLAPVTGALGSNTLSLPAATGTLATTANINTALPSATTSQIYIGTGGAGVAGILSPGTGVFTGLGTNLGAASGLAGVTTANSFTGASTHTGQEAFSGTTSVPAMTLTNAVEPATVSGSAIGASLNFDFGTQSSYWSTLAQTSNWTLNFRFSSGTSLNTAMATNQTITAVLCALQGGTAYYNNVVQIDGSSLTSGTNLFWQGGSAPSSGNASGFDCYTYTILKTGSATFTAIASQTRF